MAIRECRVHPLDWGVVMHQMLSRSNERRHRNELGNEVIGDDLENLVVPALGLAYDFLDVLGEKVLKGVDGGMAIGCPGEGRWDGVRLVGTMGGLGGVVAGRGIDSDEGGGIDVEEKKRWRQ